MLVGYNTNIPYKGRLYHIQTEDNGLKNPFIVTLLYYKGTILASKKFSYADLAARIGEDEQCEVTGPSGAEYQIEVQFLWDGQPDGHIRVFGGIDDGTFRAAFRPVCSSFIMTPDGRFLGEEAER